MAENDNNAIVTPPPITGGTGGSLTAAAVTNEMEVANERLQIEQLVANGANLTPEQIQRAKDLNIPLPGVSPEEQVATGQQPANPALAQDQNIADGISPNQGVVAEIPPAQPVLAVEEPTREEVTAKAVKSAKEMLMKKEGWAGVTMSELDTVANKTEEKMSALNNDQVAAIANTKDVVPEAAREAVKETLNKSKSLSELVNPSDFPTLAVMDLGTGKFGAIGKFTASTPQVAPAKSPDVDFPSFP